MPTITYESIMGFTPKVTLEVGNYLQGAISQDLVKVWFIQPVSRLPHCPLNVLRDCFNLFLIHYNHSIDSWSAE